MPENQGSNSPLVLRRVTGAKGTLCVMVEGNCTLAAIGDWIQQIATELSHLATEPELRWDLSQVAQMDDAGAVLLWRG